MIESKGWEEFIMTGLPGTFEDVEAMREGGNIPTGLEEPGSSLDHHTGIHTHPLPILVLV